MVASGRAGWLGELRNIVRGRSPGSGFWRLHCPFGVSLTPLIQECRSSLQTLRAHWGVPFQDIEGAQSCRTLAPVGRIV